ncbi:MAG: hypothetical protein H6677_12910 [Candidatus Obscuribacterales bacterium]|nr:hypothetical protein [Cyanobacteria bacterium HKST-UBA01]MCB9469167.1 hypothetical protein [Candidatus Obscuribacterales bacterium]
MREKKETGQCQAKARCEQQNKAGKTPIYNNPINAGAKTVQTTEHKKDKEPDEEDTHLKAHNLK